MLWLSLIYNLKLVLVGNVGFFRGIVGKVLTTYLPFFSQNKVFVLDAANSRKLVKTSVNKVFVLDGKRKHFIRGFVTTFF